MAGIVPFAFQLDESVVEIRTICNELGDPWFVLRDILSATKSSTTTTAAKSSIEQALGGGLVTDIPLETAGGTQMTTIVAEAGATFLVSRSTTEAGKKLNRFIHLEVLPQIRKTGQYARKLSPAEMIIQQGHIMLALEQEQIRQAAMQRQLEQRQESTEQRLNQIETAVDHFTIIGWSKHMKQPTLTLEMAQRMGKKATNYCLLNRIEIGKIPDPRFGDVNSYPKWVLDELFL